MSKTIVLSFKLNGTEQSVKNISELKSAIQSLESDLNNAKFGSAAFDKQKAQLDELKDKYSEMSKTASQSAKESAEKFQAAGDDFEKFSKGMVDAFTGVAIAIGASDEDTEAFMRTFVQFQGIATGVKGAIEGVLVVTKNWSAIQKVLNALLFANPLGLIILGVAALAGGIYLLIKNIDAVIEVFSDWKNIVLALLGPLGWILIAMNEIDKAEKDLDDTRKQTARNAQKIYKDRLNQIDAEKEAFVKAKDEEIYALQLEKETLEANGEASDAVTLQILEAEKEKVKATLDANKEKLQSAIDYFSFLAKLSGQSDEQFKKELKKRGVDLYKQQEQFEEIIQKNADAVQRSENNITQFKREQEEERLENSKDASEKANELYQREMTAFLQLQIDMATSEEERAAARIALLEFTSNQRIKTEQLTASEIKLIEYQLAEDIKKINDDLTTYLEMQSITKLDATKIAIIDNNKAINDAVAQGFEQLKLQQQEANAFRISEEKVTNDALLAARNELHNATFAAASNALGALSTLAGNNDKLANALFISEKALAIGKVVVDTIKSNAAATAAQTIKVAELTAIPLGAGLPFIPAAIAGFAAIKNANRIAAAGSIASLVATSFAKFKTGGASTPNGGGGASGGSSGSANIGAGGFGNVSSPTLNTQTLFSSGGGQTQTITPFGNKSAEAPIVKAIVVESDITNMQKNIFNIERRASLGITG